MFSLLIPSISLPLTAAEQDAIVVAKAKLGHLCPQELIRDAHIYKRSIDARKRDQIRLVYSVMIVLSSRPAKLNDEKLKKLGISVYEEPDLTPEIGSEPMEHRPVVVGFGPGGMFAALLLARYGYRPIVLERGSDIEQRTADVQRFHDTGILFPVTGLTPGEWRRWCSRNIYLYSPCLPVFLCNTILREEYRKSLLSAEETVFAGIRRG